MLSCQKFLFNLPEDVSYLNCAYMSPLLNKVVEAGHRGINRKVQPFSITANDFFSEVDELRKLFAQLIQVNEPGRIALIPSASYGMANVANNTPLNSGDNIVIVEEQFPSNYYIWERLAKAKGAELRTVNLANSDNYNESILENIDHRTAIVTMANVHWADGRLFDLATIREFTKNHNALFVVDGTQSVGALPTNVGELQLDAIVCAAYKWLLGPYSTGFAYYGPAFDDGKPIEESWMNRLDSEDFQNLVNYQPAYQPLAGRYIVGERSNFILNPMAKAALEQILEWEVSNIQDYCRRLTREAMIRFKEMDLVKEDHEKNYGYHLFGLRLNDQFDVGQLKMAFAKYKVSISLRGTAIRVAPHLYNNQNDMDRLLSCFEIARKKV